VRGLDEVIYNRARELFLSGGCSWSTDEFKAVLLKSGVSSNVEHRTLADLPADSILATSSLLASKGSARGYATSGPVEFLQPTPGIVGAIVIYRVEDDSLIYFADNTVASGLPLTIGAASIIVNFPRGVFRL